MGIWNRFETYIDDDGLKLNENDIYFAYPETLKDAYITESWVAENCPNIFSKDIVFDIREYPFPVSVQNKKTRKRASIKLNESGKKLPIHAGSVRQTRILFFAMPGSGKTTFYLSTIMNMKFKNAIARYSEISFREDLPEREGKHNLYIEMLKKFQKERCVKTNTAPGMKISFPYYVVGDEGERLITVTDISGEDCKWVEWDSLPIIMNDYFVVLINAEDLQKENHDYEDMLSHLLDVLDSNERKYTILLVISKADLLDWNHPLLRKMHNNTMEIDEEGAISLKVHNGKFDVEWFEEREEYIKKYLYRLAPNMMNMLNSYKKTEIRYFAISAIGKTVRRGNKEVNEPYCIDEPWLYILWKEGLYEEKYREWTVQKEIIKKLRGILGIDPTDFRSEEDD